MTDYEKALYNTIWGQWDDLLVLMVRTKDDFLSKKIELFLHAYHYSFDETKIGTNHDYLIAYLDHAMQDEDRMILKV